MNPERWQCIKEAFSVALELPPDQRAPWLSVTLPDSPSLAAEVKNLLAVHAAQDTAEDFYERGALAAVPAVRQQLEGAVEGARLGPYRVVSELGRGGMGSVYLAVRDEPGFTQKVAIKLIKRGMDTDEIVRRFVAERQILATLAHPNIARFFDGGSTPDGRPYFVMEYVEGQPITTYSEENKLSVEARLHLFLRVCRAVQHAHQSLVVHRDLKPANILVDAEGEPKLLDFGIAKLLDPSAFGRVTALTGIAPSPMTPDYASPEQRAGGPVTTATDVYGLGLLLYELLVGESPRSKQKKPSQALAARGGADKRRLARRLSGDLDTIIGKALEPDPKQRYGTAAALAEDIERHLMQRPVTARRPTLAYRLGRALIRHKFAAILALAVWVCLLAATYTYLVVRQGRERIEAQRQRTEALNDFLQGMMQRASPEQSRGETVTVRQILDAGARELQLRGARRDAETWAAFLETTGNTYADLGFYEDGRRYLEQALTLRERQPNPSREALLDIAGNWTNLGHVALLQEKYNASRSSYRRAIAIKERLLGSTALPLVRDWNGLGIIARSEGDLEAAGRYFDKSLAVSRLAEGGQRELAETYNALGFLAAAQGKLARAQIFSGAVLLYLRSTLGEDHPDTIKAESNVAFALFHRAKYAAAETHYRNIVDLRRHLLGPDHPALARSLMELAIAQRQCRHLEEAHATLGELWQIRREHRFPADQDEAEAWHLQGKVYLDQNSLEAAEDALKKSLEIYGSLSGEHRPDLANVLSSQAQVRRRRADLAGAIALARRSLELTRAANGEKHPDVADPLALLAELLQQAGSFRNAETAYRQSLSLLPDPEWANHPGKARALIGLGGLLVETARAAEARSYLEKGLHILRRALPSQDPAIARAESLRRRASPAG